MTRRNDIQLYVPITEMPNEISEGGLSGGNEHQTATLPTIVPVHGLPYDRVQDNCTPHSIEALEAVGEDQPVLEGLINEVLRAAALAVDPIFMYENETCYFDDGVIKNNFEGRIVRVIPTKQQQREVLKTYKTWLQHIVFGGPHGEK